MPKGIYKRTEGVYPRTKRTEKTKKRMSESALGNKNSVGHIVSERHKVILCRVQTGRKVSKKTKKKISQSKKGCKYPNRKKPLSFTKEHRKKISITLQRNRVKNYKSCSHCKTMDYKEWRKDVFERDDYTCQKCQVKSGNGKMVYLHPHHIQNFSQYIELRFIIDNGITFCKECHMKFHKIYGTRNNNKQQIKKFLNKNICQK